MAHRDPVDALHGVLLAMPHYEVTAREAMALADYAATTVFAEAVCEHFGGVFVPLPEGAAADDDVLQSYLGVIERMGELSREFTEARSDGVIDPVEFNSLKLRGFRTVSAVLHLIAELEGMVRAVPPSSLRKVAG